VLAVDHEVDQCVEAGVELVGRQEGEGALAIEGEEVQEEVQGEGPLVLVVAEVVIPTSPGHSVGGVHSRQAWRSGEFTTYGLMEQNTWVLYAGWESVVHYDLWNLTREENPLNNKPGTLIFA